MITQQGAYHVGRMQAFMSETLWPTLSAEILPPAVRHRPVPTPTSQRQALYERLRLSRLLRRGGIVAMVNDNVRYAGEEVPVDLILSAMAEAFGLTTRHIWTLGRGKGNSSQQMGNHGREELRKCVYVWEKP